MTSLLALELPRSLDQLLERAARERPSRIEAWLFDDEAARRTAERRLADLGVAARLHSAYKPLLHAFLEDSALQNPSRVSITVAESALQRLKVEAYPLAALLGGASLEFLSTTEQPVSEVVVSLNGVCHELFVPLRADFSPTAWLRLWQGDTLLEDGPLHSDYQAAFEAVLVAVADHTWPEAAPYFEVLQIDIAIVGIERKLDYGEEVISTREALHEDLYFSLLEFFQRRAGKPAGDRTLRPGQIVPNVVASDGSTRVSVHLNSHRAAASVQMSAPELSQLERPLHPDEVSALLRPLHGERFGCQSWQGRSVEGLYQSGALPGVVISAGQHANESSGVVGALRAVQSLQLQPGAHYAVVALENPDGATLHHALCQGNARHMQHAARFTALGDDLEARQGAELGEKAVRQEAIARTQAGLHFSLHGYPAHEWTRPFSGYLPPRSEDWTLPKGFFLILRQHPGHDGWPFLQALTAALAQDPALREFNARQHALWRAHWGELPYPVLNGIACLVSEDQRSRVPFTLISEFPDETIYGEAFRLAHETQTRTVLLGTQLYWQGLLGKVRAT
jgi:hypothetical protein